MLDAIGLLAALALRAGRRDLRPAGRPPSRYLPAALSGVRRRQELRGGNPPVGPSPILTRLVHEQLAAELALVPQALVLPLGKAVEGCLRILMAADQLNERRCLFGFPHPSGANGHRAAHFRENQPALTAQLLGGPPTSGSTCAFANPGRSGSGVAQGPVRVSIARRMECHEGGPPAAD
jgi:hypothetical protein